MLCNKMAHKKEITAETNHKIIALVKFTMRNRSEINKLHINREHEPDKSDRK